jgi:hypothetical protein
MKKMRAALFGGEAVIRRSAMRGLALVAVICIASRPALAQADAVVDIGSRGQKIRALVLQPSNPTGSVVLLASCRPDRDRACHSPGSQQHVAL